MRLVEKPLTAGIYIVRFADGTAKKVNFVGRFDVAKGAKINIVKKED